MDLVSSTLDKYLKHRFNGSALIEKTSDMRSTEQPESDKNTTTVPPTPHETNPPVSQMAQDTSLPQGKESNSAQSLETKDAHSEQTNDLVRAQILSETVNCIREQDGQKQEQQNRIENYKDIVMTNGFSDDESKLLPTVHRVSISNSRPCCISIREDSLYFAAGFENSHIYVWHSKDNIFCKASAITMFRLLAHSGPVYSIEFINNNDLMISCSEDTTIRLWCLNTKCNVVIYRGHNYPIWSLAVGPQGKYFASASMDATARLWRLDRVTPLRIFCGHDDDVECLKFHPNEKYIATGSSDSTVRLWSTSDGKMVRLMVGHKSSIISLSFLPNGKFLASASQDGSVKVWNLATNCALKEHSLPPSCAISFSLDLNFVASCGVDNVLRIWQVKDTELIEKRKVDPAKDRAKLIQTNFHNSDRLYVVEYDYTSQEQRNK